MVDYYRNNKTWDRSSMNISFDFSDEWSGYLSAFRQAALFFVFFGLVVTLAAIFAVFSLVRKDHAAPVYIVNLLFSDLLQLCCNIENLLHGRELIPLFLFVVGLVASVGFMLCVSMERYLVIAKPLWYKLRRNIRTSLVVCASVWVVAFLLMLTVIMCSIFNLFNCEILFILIPCFFLLPLPFFVFFLVGTIRALSAAISVPAEEKRRIVAILVLMLFVYNLLFLPIILFCLVPQLRFNPIFSITAMLVLSISPLADSSLYILLRKGALDKVFASLCCCKTSDDQQTSSRHDDSTSGPCTETV